MRDRELDQELSALLDGELSPARARELREEIEADSALGDRLAAFESVDQLLQSLPGPELQDDLRSRLQQRIDPLERSSEFSPLESSRPRQPLVRWGVPLAAALAAGLMAIWLTRPVVDSEVVVADVIVPASEGRDLIASDSDDAGAAIEDASDEEIAIAFELETLREIEMIWELDLLEALLAMEDTEGRNGSRDSDSTLDGLDGKNAPIEERG